MSTQPTFTGTPDDWWENAERITIEESMQKQMGNWYITKMKPYSSGWHPSPEDEAKDSGAYRIATPTKPPAVAKIPEHQRQDEAEWCRLLIRGENKMPAWVGAMYVMADVPGSEGQKGAWVRNNSGRWKLISDNRITVNDRTMENLNPVPAIFTQATDIL